MTSLDRALDEWAAKSGKRSRSADAAFNRARDRALADPHCHPLRRARLTYATHGLTVQELAEKAGVGDSTIRKIEDGGIVGDDVWHKLTLTLGVPRARIDKSFLYVT